MSGERRRRWIRVRVLMLASLVLLGALLVMGRAWELTMQHGPGLSRLAARQQHLRVRLAPRRGTLYDRHGAELAVSVDVESVFGNPRAMRAEGVDPLRAARQLAAILDVRPETLERRFASDRYFVWVDRQVTPAQAEAVRALDIDGIQLTREARRFYPNRELAAHLIGFANIDGVGIEGLELSLEERLAGTTEPVEALVDRRRQVVFSDRLLDDRAVQGDDIYLTLDRTIQHVAERELALAVNTFEARAGSVVVLDPANGDILAMANYPTFNPNAPGASPAAHRRNRAVTDRFEPGSTVKPFTVAAALAAHVLRPEQPIDCLGGEMTIGDDRIRDTHRFDSLSPAEVLTYSSNIGAATIGGFLGRRGLYRAFRRFGFGEQTGLPVPGETGGILHHYRRWYDLDLATIAFGQGLSVTTVQLASAMGALAHRGRLMQPRLIRRVVDSHGRTVDEPRPRAVRQVVPARTARLVADMLTAVTGDGGTGVEAAIDGYLVAGKTGTAQKADYVRGGYADGLYIASFVGFVPAEDPALVIAVVIDEPQVEHYGGTVAGPVFRRVGAAALRHLGVPAQGGGEALTALGRRSAPRPEPEAGAEPPSVPAPPRPPEIDEVQVPDLTGLTARRAIVALDRVELAFDLRGEGAVAAQHPEPGTLLPRGETVVVELARPDARFAAAPGPEPAEVLR
jgi:cell division protein FtsI (penicillin-binding protein 3)